MNSKAHFYENQGIGRFIFQLGFQAGLHRIVHVVANQFQQTPLDAALGDLSLEAADRFLMLEFKAENSDSPESEKLGIRAQVRHNLQSNWNNHLPYRPGQAAMDVPRKYGEVGEECHFFGTLHPDPDLDAYKPYGHEVCTLHVKPVAVSSQRCFIDGLLFQVPSVPKLGVEKSEFQAYLNMLIKGAGRPSTSGDYLVYVVRVAADGQSVSFAVEDLAAHFPQLPPVPIRKWE